MSTSNIFANITSKKLLTYSDLYDRFLQYLKELTHESLEQVWDDPVVHNTALAIEADGSNAFKITGTSVASDGLGHLLSINDATVNDGIDFENTTSIPYYVALKYTEIPEEIDVNPRTGLPEYREWIEDIGEKAVPDDVTDNGDDTITLQVDSVTESGVSNAGRQVMVYKLVADKNATTASVAIETCTVTWSGTQNEITTTGALGQSSISETAADYNVIMLGPTVKRNTDLRYTDGYVFIGIITGNGGTPSSFDHSAQQISEMTLSQMSQIVQELENAAPKGLSIDGDINDHILRLYTPENSISHPSDELNVIDTGDSSKEYADLTFTIVNNVKKVIAVDMNSGACEADVFNIDSMTHESTEDLSVGLPSGGGEDWWSISICNDGTYAYILFIDDNASPKVSRIQSYDLTDWSVNSSWPSTGVALTTPDTTGLGKIICATSSKLAVSQPGVYITGGSSAGVAIHDMSDGSQLGYGCGDTSFTDGRVEGMSGGASGLCSDGTYVYFAIRNSVGNIEICSMSIASMGSTGCGGSNWPTYAVYSSKYLGDISCAGHLIVSTYYSSADPMIRVHTSDDAEIGDITIASGISALYNLVFDGHRFWARGVYDTTWACLARLDVVHKVPGGAYAESNGEDDIKLFTDSFYGASFDTGPIVFDGKDFWYAMKSGTNKKGKLYRFAKPIIR